MSTCRCPACIGRHTKWDTTPPGWTDGTRSPLPELPEYLQQQPFSHRICQAESNVVGDGTFLWVETTAAGHAFVTIHQHGKITVYTYGRYGDVQPGNPMVGEGVLLRMSDNSASQAYLSEQLYRLQAKVFKILDADPVAIDGYLSGIYTGSTQASRNPRGDMTRQYGRVIDQYDLTGSNCTTHSVKAIRFGGSRIFERTIIGFTYSDDFTIPGSLLRYMEQVSGDVADLRAMEVTPQMKAWISNTRGWRPGEESPEDVVMGSSASGSGYAGSSTGYAGGTIDGSLGGMYEPENR